MLIIYIKFRNKSAPLNVFTVDLASIDRRDHQREHETATRVRHLVDTFFKSEIHNQTLNDVNEATLRPTNRATMLYFYKPRPPNVFRVMFTLWK